MRCLTTVPNRHSSIVPDHFGGRPRKINAWFLYTHMVYLKPKQSLGYQRHSFRLLLLYTHNWYHSFIASILQGAPAIFGLLLNSQGGSKHGLYIFCFPNQIFSIVIRCRNINKGVSSINHLATGDELSDHFRQTLRRTVRTGGTGSLRNSKETRF
jgi:hypothetical protein